MRNAIRYSRQGKFKQHRALLRRPWLGQTGRANTRIPAERRFLGGGEVARYLGKYGSKGVSKAVIISGVPPYLLKTADNPEGVDASVFAGIEKAVAADRYAFFTEFFKNFYNTDVFLGKRVSEQA